MIYPDNSLLHNFEQTISKHALFSSGDTLVVAISGGADSTALLDMLVRLPLMKLNLVAAHLNHNLRGAESDTDQEFCRELASRYAIAFETKLIDVRKISVEGQTNLEDAGRQARIEFLDEVRRKYNAAAVVLAHHADDQAETVLMRLLRGSGMTGLAGMSYCNARNYVRPLLDVSRSEIEQYLRERGLDWREDASNRDTVYMRNSIRHELLPFLERYNPAVRSRLAATASLIREDNALLEELTEKSFDRSCRLEEGRVACSITQIRSFTPALQRRVMRHAIKQLTGSLVGVCLHHVEALCELVASERPNSRLSLPQQITAVREYGSLFFMRMETDATFETDFELVVYEPGFYKLPSGGSIIIESGATAPDKADACRAEFDPVKTPFPWLFRNVHPGDRMRPLGMHGRKKVKDIFIDRKVPLSERKRIPLLFCGDDLIWIAGVCVSEICRKSSASGATLRVEWHR